MHSLPQTAVVDEVGEKEFRGCRWFASNCTARNGRVKRSDPGCWCLNSILTTTSPCFQGIYCSVKPRETNWYLLVRVAHSTPCEPSLWDGNRCSLSLCLIARPLSATPYRDSLPDIWTRLPDSEGGSKHTRILNVEQDLILWGQEKRSINKQSHKNVQALPWVVSQSV